MPSLSRISIIALLITLVVLFAYQGNAIIELPATTLFGLDSGASLATVVGVLTEVPIMLFLVWLCKRTRSFFR